MKLMPRKHDTGLLNINANAGGDSCENLIFGVISASSHMKWY